MMYDLVPSTTTFFPELSFSLQTEAHTEQTTMKNKLLEFEEHNLVVCYKLKFGTIFVQLF